MSMGMSGGGEGGEVEGVTDMTFDDGRRGFLRIDDEAMKAIINRVIDDGTLVPVTRGGKMAALIIPMTLPELVSRDLAARPNLAAHLADAAADPEQGVSMDEVDLIGLNTTTPDDVE